MSTSNSRETSIKDVLIFMITYWGKALTSTNYLMICQAWCVVTVINQICCVLIINLLPILTPDVYLVLPKCVDCETEARRKMARSLLIKNEFLQSIGPVEIEAGFWAGTPMVQLSSFSSWIHLFWPLKNLRKYQSFFIWFYANLPFFLIRIFNIFLFFGISLTLYMANSKHSRVFSKYICSKSDSLISISRGVKTM